MAWGRWHGWGRLLAAAFWGAAVAASCAPLASAQVSNPLRLEQKPVSSLAQPHATRPRIAVTKPQDAYAATTPNQPVSAPAGQVVQVAERPGETAAAQAAWLQTAPPTASSPRIDSAQPTLPSQPMELSAAAGPPFADPAELAAPHAEGHWPSEAPAEDFFHRPFLPGWFAHTDPNDPERHFGWGEPLQGTSWRNRPWYVGFFFGGVLADELVDTRVHQSNGAFYGFRVGNDFDHYWAAEFRYAFARLNNTTPAGVQFDDSYDYWLDVSILHYPWGDTRLRPYLQAGLGFATYRFTDVNRVVHDSSLTLPLGGGLKYFYSPTCSLRFDVTDNLSFGTGTIDTMHNISFTAGVEFRFGGRRCGYYPWHGGSVLW